MYPRVKLAKKASPEKIRVKLARHYPDSTPTTLIASLRDDTRITIQVYAGNGLPVALRSWIFNLFEANMKTMYEASSDGYDPQERKAELFDQQSRFLVLRPESRVSGVVLEPIAFSMFRFDTEETAGSKYAEVVYCYEVQVDIGYASKGAGKLLVEIMNHIGKDWEMEKVMLTVFKFNEQARVFYERIGFVEDEISPGQCGEIEDYNILSKTIV